MSAPVKVRSPDTPRPRPLDELPFRVARLDTVFLEYDDESVLPTGRRLKQPFRLRVDERPGKQVLELVEAYRLLESELGAFASELDEYRSRLREAEAEVASLRGVVADLKGKAAKAKT